MLLRIFAAIGAAGSVLHTLIAGQAGGALKVTGVMLLRFLEYFFGAHIAYALIMLISTELFINKNKPQEKPSKFWLWHLHAVADLLCFYARADVSITGTELIPKDTRYLMVANHRSLADPVVMVHKMPKEELTFVSKPGNLKIPIIGKVMHKCGCLPLDRENNREALKPSRRRPSISTRTMPPLSFIPRARAASRRICCRFTQARSRSRRERTSPSCALRCAIPTGSFTTSHLKRRMYT